MHGEKIYFSDQNLVQDSSVPVEGTNTHFKQNFKNFIAEFSKDNRRIYHQHLLNAVQQQQKKYYLPVHLSDLKETNESLYEKYVSSPLEMLGVMDEAVKSYVKERNE